MPLPYPRISHQELLAAGDTDQSGLLFRGEREESRMKLKAIDTKYNGYLFRSRLEARWAVFFDHLGLKYEYEKEGYDLDGLWYLPDFWLPDVALRRSKETGLWMEVKGGKPTAEEDEKCVRLAKASRKPVILMAGQCDGEQKETGYEYAPVEGAHPVIENLRWAGFEVKVVDDKICYSRQDEPESLEFARHWIEQLEERKEEILQYMSECPVDVRWDNYMHFMKCVQCGQVKVEFLESSYMTCGMCGAYSGDEVYELASAYDAAKQARF